MKKIRSKEENLPNEYLVVLTSSTEQLQCIDREAAAKHAEILLNNANCSFRFLVVSDDKN